MSRILELFCHFHLLNHAWLQCNYRAETAWVMQAINSHLHYCLLQDLRLKLTWMNLKLIQYNLGSFSPRQGKYHQLHWLLAAWLRSQNPNPKWSRKGLAWFHPTTCIYSPDKSLLGHLEAHMPYELLIHLKRPLSWLHGVEVGALCLLCRVQIYLLL